MDKAQAHEAMTLLQRLKELGIDDGLLRALEGNIYIQLETHRRLQTKQLTA